MGYGKYEGWKKYPCGREWADKSRKCTRDFLCAWCHATKLTEGQVHNMNIGYESMKKARDMLYEDVKKLKSEGIIRRYWRKLFGIGWFEPH